MEVGDGGGNSIICGNGVCDCNGARKKMKGKTVEVELLESLPKWVKAGAGQLSNVDMTENNNRDEFPTFAYNTLRPQPYSYRLTVV